MTQPQPARGFSGNVFDWVKNHGLEKWRWKDYIERWKKGWISSETAIMSNDAYHAIRSWLQTLSNLGLQMSFHFRPSPEHCCVYLSSTGDYNEWKILNWIHMCLVRPIASSYECSHPQTLLLCIHKYAKSSSLYLHKVHSHQAIKQYLDVNTHISIWDIL